MKFKKLMAMAAAAVLSVAAAAPVFAEDGPALDTTNSAIEASKGPEGTVESKGWFYKDGWFYRDTNGQLKTGWLQNGGVWYYLQNDGKMASGWLNLGGNWYYFAHNGEMLNNGWNWINGKCYYFQDSGVMAADTVIDGYTVDASGAWVK